MHTHIFKCIQSCEQPAHRRELCVVASVLCAVSHPCVSDLECLKDAFLGRVLHPFVPDLLCLKDAFLGRVLHPFVPDLVSEGPIPGSWNSAPHESGSRGRDVKANLSRYYWHALTVSEFHTTPSRLWGQGT